MTVALPPDELKLIRPFVHRGNQMSTRDPVVTYYCYYWAVSTAIGKGLHKTSPECKIYMVDLMQELESMKEKMTDNDLITDQMAAQAYVENFANRIFGNASKPVDAGRANEKTPDALQAAATFLEVTKIWEESDLEVSKKIKYAKFHAARILKALKEGKDPNPPKAPATSSVIEDAPSETSGPPPPLVDEIPDEFYSPRQPTPSSLAPPPPPPIIENLSSSQPDLRPSTPPKDENYFPSVPSVHEPSPPGLSPATMGLPDMMHTHLPPAPSSPPPPPPAAPSFPSPPPTAHGFPPSAPLPFGHHPPFAPSPASAAQFQPPPPPNPYEAAVAAPPPASNYYHQPPQAPTVYRRKKELSPEEITKAQKYAKWAISALDYDDVDNAIEQFQKGLEILMGAR